MNIHQKGYLCEESIYELLLQLRDEMTTSGTPFKVYWSYKLRTLYPDICEMYESNGVDFVVVTNNETHYIQVKYHDGLNQTEPNYRFKGKRHVWKIVSGIDNITTHDLAVALRTEGVAVI